MADQHSSDDLSPSLQAVLSSLNVNLENELNRYRRNRLTNGSSADDLFADLEDPALDLETAEPPMLAPAVTVSALAVPPPLPPNKKLLGHAEAVVDGPSDRPSDVLEDVLETMPVWQSGLSASGSLYPDAIAHTSPTEPLARMLPTADPLGDYAINADPGGVETTVHTVAATPSSGYLASSEKLIESLSEVPPMPEPIGSSTSRASLPRRKTVSLLAGATLGLLGLVAGLGASYLMSNPRVVQRLADRFMRDQPVVATAAKETFDPPGPDLSAQEFVEVETDNLSSLKMPTTTVDPLLAPAPTSPTALPPISNQLGTQPSSTQPSGIQAAAIPAGSNYYVIAPFTTEQGLADVRQSVQEAFVRQFSDGNRVQLAVFDNAEMAQQLVAELKGKGVSAQVYGPTAE
jgi:hypothetical protein